jgi:spore maturation protein B
MAVYIVPVFILFIFIYAGIKGTDTYSAFVRGSRDALNLVIQLIPFITAILTAVALFQVSGLLSALCGIVSPVFRFMGIPPELTHFIFLKPFSGTGSIALYDGIVTQYGADSYITRTASVVAGSSDTIFYISAVYFSKTEIKKLGLAIPIALFCTFISAVLAAFVCRIL